MLSKRARLVLAITLVASLLTILGISGSSIQCQWIVCRLNPTMAVAEHRSSIRNVLIITGCTTSLTMEAIPGTMRTTKNMPAAFT